MTCWRRFDDIKSGKTVQLFKSHRDGVADGDQRRDFIYVDDIVRVIMWLLALGNVNGIFNVGTGKARSFRELIVSLTMRWVQARRSSTSTCPCRSQQLPVFCASFRRTPRRRLAASPRSRTRFQFTSRTSSIGRIATANRSIAQR
jgi:UDP-glucose 4-epimerase